MDEGIGEHIGRIFDMVRPLRTHDENEGGRDRLAVGEKIVERHGGRIWVESVPGEGSTFLLTQLAA